MSPTIRIPPAPGANFFADPQEVFAPLEPAAAALDWVLWGTAWLTAKPGIDLDVQALEERVQGAPHGVPFSWPDLHELIHSLSQVIDGTFIGLRNGAAAPPWPETGLDEVHRTRDLVITADDSSYWWVSGAPEVVERVATAFPHATRAQGFS